MHAFSIRPPWPGAIRLATSNRISVRGYPLFQRTIFSPCGHAAHVDSVDFFASLALAQNSTLPTIAWITLRVLHMTTRPATTIFLSKSPTSQPSGVFRRKTHQKTDRLLNVG
jgi:hypothetical protein